jgi:hypothetical protein
MDPARRISATVGALFIGATASQILGSAVLPDSAGLVHQPARVALASVLFLVAAGTSASIPVTMYPVLRQSSHVLALESVVFRAIEAVCYALGVICLLTVAVPQTQPPQRTSWQPESAALLGLRDHAVLIGVVGFCIGALAYYLVFYRSQLVPRWLAGWGVLGSLLMLTACALALFADKPVTGYTALILPIAVQELVLAGWLLARGFDLQPRHAPVPSHT